MRSSSYVLALACLVGCDDGMRSRVDPTPPDVTDPGAVDGAMVHDAMVDASPGSPAPVDAAVDLGMAPDAIAAPDADISPDGFVDDCPFEVVASHPRASRLYDPIVDGDTVYIHERGPEGLLRTIRADDSTPVTALGGEIISARDGALLLFRRDLPGTLRTYYVDAGGEQLVNDRLPGLTLASPADRPDLRSPQWVQPGRALYLNAGQLAVWQDGAPIGPEDGPEMSEGWLVGMATSGDVVGQVRWLDTMPATYEVWLGDRRVLGPDPDWDKGTLRATDDGLWVGLGHRAHYIPLDGGPARSWGRAGHTVRAIDVSDSAAIAVLQDEQGHDSLWRLPLDDAPLADAPLLHGGVIVARLAGDTLVVARWPRSENGCGELRGGELFWGPIGVPGRSLGLLHSGCDCCDRMPPKWTLSVSETTLAWSTWRPAGEDRQGRVNIARRRCR